MTKQRIDGVDLSHWQAKLAIDWAKAKAGGVKFVVHKATEGLSYVDPSYATRRAETHANGVIFGAYHFARPAVGNARAEAKFFLDHATPRKGELIPMLDLEANDHNMTQAELTRWVRNWFRYVFKHSDARRGWLYTHFDLDSKPKGVFLWVPRYSDTNAAPRVPKPFWRWRIWQFSDGRYGVPNSVPGIGNVDINHLRAFRPLYRLRRYYTI